MAEQGFGCDGLPAAKSGRQSVTTGSMRGVAGLTLCLLLVGCCAAESFVRVPLKKKPITAERLQAASQVAAKASADNGLLEAHVEADIPLLDYLDAQARSSSSCSCSGRTFCQVMLCCLSLSKPVASVRLSGH